MSSELLKVAGSRCVEHAPLGARTTYRVGGTARYLVTLQTLDDVRDIAPTLFASGLPVVVVGNGSNLLVAEGELDVIAVALEGDFERLAWHDLDGVVVVEAGAALDLPVAARRLAGEGISGFEWAVGVPGTFGGAAVMNAGGHGSDMAASVLTVQTWSNGALRSWSLDELNFSYRSSALTQSDIVLSVSLHLEHGDATQSKEQLSSIVKWRRDHQPGGQNAGSVFRNPEGDHAGRLIEASGLKGYRLGSAQVSDKHANFIIADAGGSAQDVYDLIGLVRASVREHFAIDLIPENKFLGFTSPL